VGFWLHRCAGLEPLDSIRILDLVLNGERQNAGQPTLFMMDLALILANRDQLATDGIRPN